MPLVERRMPHAAALAALALCASVGCARHHAVYGTVVDRNGEPLDRAIIRLDPGGVELVTDSEGGFMVDYVREDDGARAKLPKRTDYTIEAFKTGYHIETMGFYFKKGELFIDPITLTADTIKVDDPDANIDPAQYPDRTHSAGTNYEGE